MLAKAVGQLAMMLAVLSPSRASSLPQFWFRGGRKIQSHRQSPVGASLLAKGVGQLADDVGCAAVFASRLAPTLISVGRKIQSHRQSPVGAGLLAKAAGQLAMMLAVLSPSRAGSLPH
ncbi:hypothetical protein CRX69_01980 [Pseudomonas rhizophila]|uniref:Secreted protein n=1 Tax=Pseudomonas rhizophila TaxID=2045200 RepID=A0ABM6U9B6_9PSED|nr:hypothetical protein CRX69_01980 [Pseudomonas rhizophila]